MSISEQDVIYLDRGFFTRTGYEEYYPLFDKFRTQYQSSSYEDKQKIIENVIDIYHNVKIFPMKYLGNNDIRDDLRSVSLSKVSIVDNVLSGRDISGLGACRTLVPNISKAKGTGRGIKGELDTFIESKLLYRTIKFILDNDESVYPNSVRRAMALTSAAVQNFPPSKSKSIYDKYCNKGDIVYDFSCGFGGRLVGSYATRKNLTYIGVEPNTETYSNLINLDIECSKAYRVKNSRTKIYCTGSEDFVLDENSVDFAFSSPPYFNKEVYSDDITQCYNKFPVYNDWLNYYVIPTMANIRRGLKPNKYVAVNIANNKKHSLYDDWLNASICLGFKLDHEIVMELSKCGKSNRHDCEKIMVLKNIKN